MTATVVSRGTATVVPRGTATVVPRGTIYASATAQRQRTDLPGPPIRREPAPVRKSPVSYLPWLLLVVSGTLWLMSLSGLRHAAVSQYGLLIEGPATFPAALLVATLAFLVAVRRRNEVAALAAIFGLIVVQRLTISLVTEVAPYSWTYKHIGVADHIIQTGTLARGADIYNGWPGLFAAAAAFSEATGVSLISLAHWFTIGVHVLIVLAVMACGRAWGLSRMHAIVAAFLVEVINWVAQDYFAPQAVAFILMLSFFAVLGHFRRGRSAAGVTLALLLFAAIVVTHQLTPFWVLLSTGLLVVTRRVRPWWIVLPMAAIIGLWLVVSWDAASGFLSFSADPVSNAKSPIPTVGVLGQQITSAVVRAMTVSVYLMAFAAAVALRRRRTLMVAGSILAFSPVLILGGQSYGGEAIFRVFLYSMLGCSLLLAPILCDLLQRSWTKFLVAGLVSALLVVSSAQGYLGGWSANLMTAAQVRLADDLLNRVPFPSYVTVAAPVWPERINGRYAEFARFAKDYDQPMIYSAHLVGANFDTDASYDTFMRLVAGREGGANYLIISEQMRIYNWYFGILPPHALDNLEARMRADPRWRLVLDRDGVVIFRSQKATTPPHKVVRR